MKIIRPLLFFLCISMIVSCREAPQDSRQPSQRSQEELVEEVKAFYKEYETSVPSGDLELLLSHISDDAIWMPPQETAMQGKEKVRAWLQEYFKDYSMEERFLIQEIRSADGWALVRGSYVFQAVPKASGSRISNHGTFVAVLERNTHATWQVSREIWNGDSTNL